MKKLILALIFAFPVIITYGQQEGFEYDNRVYIDYIKSVKLNLTGAFTSLPIVALDAPGTMTLRFDDLEGGSKYYYYTIIHCDQNWNPTEELENYEYNDGYENEEIRDYEYSINTRVDYTHYWLTLPNENVNWKLSGNYLLVIYDTEDDDKVIITRRFMVVDTKVGIQANVVKAADVGKLRTHHEVDFRIDVGEMRLTNPREEITAVLMQNGRWDNAYTGIKHKFERGEYLQYDYQDKLTFHAGKDFRNIDVRSTRYRSENVLSIERYSDGISVIAKREEPRSYKNFVTEKDINGNFVIQTVDDNDIQLEAEYVEYVATLDVDDPLNEDVYIFGGLTDWQLNPEFRLNWDDRVNGYIGKFLLKQGFYDYIYVIADEFGDANEQYLEGDWHEAHNSYTILVYYRPFGERYDMLIGAHTFQSFE